MQYNILAELWQILHEKFFCLQAKVNADIINHGVNHFLCEEQYLQY